MMLSKHRFDEEDAAFPFPAASLDACRDFQALQRGEPAEPEKKLMLAMLEDALRCREKYRHAKDRRGKKFFLEAEEWLLCEAEDWIFSLGNVCEALGLNPGYIRKCAVHGGRGYRGGLGHGAIDPLPEAVASFPIEARL